MSPERDRHTVLRRRLEGFGRWRRRWALGEGLARFVVAGPGLILAWFLLDWAVGLGPWVLIVSFAGIVVLGLAALIWWALRPLLRRVRPEREALTIEALHGELDNVMIGSLQLGREVRESEATARELGYAPSLARELVRRTVRDWDEIDPRGLVDRRTPRRWLCAAAAIALAVGGCLLLARGAVRARIDRLRYAYATVLDTFFPVTLAVRPGDVTLVRGEDVTLEVEVKGARRRAVRLVRTPVGEDASPQTERLALDGEGGASRRLPAVEESFTYRFEYARTSSQTHRVTVGDLPRIEAMNFELMYPAYTGQPTRTLVGRLPRLQALVGTNVLVSFAATTDLHPELCHVRWQDGPPQPVSVNGRFGHFSFTVQKPERATLRLFGALGRKFEMERPVSFEVSVRADEKPTVQILLRRRKLTMLTEEAEAFGFRFLAEDDFGISHVRLQYSIESVDELLGGPRRDGELTRDVDPPRDRVKEEFTEMLKGLNPRLKPGDRVRMTVIVHDNSSETDPNTGKSQPVEIVVVRPDLGEFVEKEFGFKQRSLLGELHKIKRETNLLVDPMRSVRTEKRFKL